MRVVADDRAPHDRSDAVGADHELGVHIGRAVDAQRHAIDALVEGRHAGIEHDRLRIHGVHRPLQRQVQVAAVDLEVRRTVALRMLFAQRQPVQHLAAVEAAEFERLGQHAGARDRLAQAQHIEHLHRVGAHLDAGAHLAELRRLLVDPHAMAALQQRGGRGQAAEAGTDDGDVHARPPRLSVAGDALRLHHAQPALRACTRFGRAAAADPALPGRWRRFSPCKAKNARQPLASAQALARCWLAPLEGEAPKALRG
jgi:hypothetical protein